MSLFNFLRRDEGNFYQWFEDAANNMLVAARTVRDICYNVGDIQEQVNLVHDYEHRGDEIGHRIYEQLNRTFVTPLDREDIISLYSSIDDVTDFVHSAADMMVVYKVGDIPETARLLADCVVGCAEEVVKAVPYLRKRSELTRILPSVIQINSLENQADTVLRNGLVELFSHPEDVVRIIKWRDIYEELEGATDRAEDIADILRGLAIKNA